MLPHAHLIDLIESLGLESLFNLVEEIQILDAESVPLRPCDAVTAQPLVLEAPRAFSATQHRQSGPISGPDRLA